MMKACNKSRGFTLIELLVVIAIIAILAAILFPVFAKAREKARQTACLSNTKQIGLAMMQYLQDYDSQFPPAWAWYGQTDPRTSTWPWLLQSYAKSPQIFGCPSGPWGQAPPAEKWSLGYMGYCLNVVVSYSDSGGTITQFAPWCSKLTESSLQEPASFYLFLEGGSTIVDYWYATNPNWETYLAGSGAHGVSGTAVDPAYLSDFNKDRHIEGQNVVFGDGHAKYMTTSRLVNEMNDINSKWASILGTDLPLGWFGTRTPGS